MNNNPVNQYRNVILLTELIGVIHDIGKVSDDLKKQGENVRPYINHILVPYVELGGDFDLLKYEYENPNIDDVYSQCSKNGIEYPPNLKKTKIKNSLFSSNELMMIRDQMPHTTESGFTLGKILGPAIADKSIREIFIEEKNESVENTSFISLFLRHHENGGIYNKNLLPKSHFTKVLSFCDSMDSREERINFELEKKDSGDIESADSQQKSTPKHKPTRTQMAVVSTVFGMEKEIEVEKLEKARFDTYAAVNTILKNFESLSNNPSDYLYEHIHDQILSLKQYLNLASAMTVLPDNDTTVWDHGYMTGSIAKALIAGYFLNQILPKQIQSQPIEILAIQFPGRDFLTNVYRMPDFIGREQILQDVRMKVKRLIEVSYCLGNLVYEDINGMYFLIPVLPEQVKWNLHQDIKKLFSDNLGYLVPFITSQNIPMKVFKKGEKHKELNFGRNIVKLKKGYESNFKRKLGGVKTKQLELPAWVEEWNNHTPHKGICMVCRRGVAQLTEEGQYDKDELCFWCNHVRRKGFNGSDAAEGCARFIDQVMDTNHQVVLLTGDLGLFDLWLQGDYIKTTRYESTAWEPIPKEPSPSRLRRVYEEAIDFQEEIEKLLKENKKLKGITFIFDLKANRPNQVKSKQEFWNHSFDTDQLYEIVQKELHSCKRINDNDIPKLSHVIVDYITFKGEKPYSIFVQESNSRAEGVCGYTCLDIPGLEKEFPQLLLDIFTKYFNKPRIFKCKKLNTTITISCDSIFLKEIVKVRKVYGMVDEFMYLLPANEIFPLIERIQEKFENRFGRVKGRLTLNLGLVFADHKYPLYLVLDGGKRMLNEFREALVRDRSHGKDQDVVEGLDAHFVWDKKQGEGTIQFIDPLFSNEKISFKLPIPIRTYKSDHHTDRYYSGLICPSEYRRILGAHRIAQMGSGTKKDIIYAPDLIDFEYLDNVRSRIQIGLSQDEGQWKKRDHLIRYLKKRPYLSYQFMELKEFNEELDRAKVTNSGLKKFESIMIDHLHRLCTSEEEYVHQSKLMEQIAVSVLMNIDTMNKFFKKLSEDRRKEWLQLFTDGRFFDLMELRTFIQVFPKGGISIE